jgi:hypothetical protein
MSMRHWRTRTYVLALSALSFLTMGGCGLTDQQLASIWESAISSVVSALISTAVQTATGQTG